ncbi:hypothetical protein M0811_10083 [Anaeramoeba ignava]|uniref:Uncharacterized protein n=1 Tax=Anaeramoeba ignava TaxID=1746090 RepID=A0A9Q0LFY7_ANAIG|nr:hypothetical protein M0811_10083 [Anaeramoeba ignava]
MNFQKLKPLKNRFISLLSQKDELEEIKIQLIKKKEKIQKVDQILLKSKEKIENLNLQMESIKKTWEDKINLKKKEIQNISNQLQKIQLEFQENEKKNLKQIETLKSIFDSKLKEKESLILEMKKTETNLEEIKKEIELKKRRKKTK